MNCESSPRAVTLVANYTEVPGGTVGVRVGGGHHRTAGLEESGSEIWGKWFQCGKTSNLHLKIYLLRYSSPKVKFSILKGTIQW
jgi:hypothetical protein